ncbi:hypothetical protein ECP030477712_5022, partial [Escherichia coli P0304777.12]
MFNLNTGPLHSDVIRGIQRGSACSVCKVDGIPTRTFPGKSNVTGRQPVVAFKVDGIPTRTFPGKSNVTGRQPVVAFKVDGIPTRTAPGKSNVIRGIQRGSACKVDGIPTRTAPGKSIVGGRQRGIADFRAGHCRIQRKVARGDVGVFNLNTGPLHSDVIRGIQRGSACSVCKVDGIPTRTFPGKSNVTGRQPVV